MFERLMLKLRTIFGGKKDDFRKDSRNHALANRFDVDEFPNDPDDFDTPPLRLPTDRKERAKLLESLKGMKPPKSISGA